jgi:predicted dehydrogenase
MVIRVGIVGCGSISAFRHVPEYAVNPNARLAAYCDPQADRAVKLAALYGGQVAADYREIIEAPEIDAISDCSTNEMHHIITTAALEHGKHVLCEKPMALTREGANMMLAANRKSGKVLMVAHNQRLAPAHRKAKAILQSGELGKVLTFATVFGHKGPEYWSADKSKATWFFDRARSGFGVAGDLGIHKIDLLRYLLDDEFVEVSAQEGVLDKTDSAGQPIAVSDNMVALLKTARGALGTLTVSWTYYGPESNSTTLYCQAGIMQLYGDPTYQIVIRKLDGEEALYKVGEIQTNDRQTNSGVIDAFIDAIQRGTPPPVSGEDGLQGLEVVWAATESATKGVRVQLPHGERGL